MAHDEQRSKADHRMDPVIRTKPGRAVAEFMLGNPGGRYYGYDLTKATGVRAGTLYPMLWRWLNDGLLTASWQEPHDMDERQHLPRRYYTLTDKGCAELSFLLEQI